MSNILNFLQSENFFTLRIFSHCILVTVIIFNLSSKTFAAVPTTMLDESKDILIAQSDNKTDRDAIHSQAALASLLAHSDFCGVNYLAVAGAYGTQSGKYINSNSLFTMAFGAQNAKWTDANKDRANSIIRILDKAKQVLLAGGRVWVQEAGQSDITTDCNAALISSWITATKIKTNDDNTTAANLTYVKKTANYIAEDDGSNPSGAGINRGPNTPDYNLASTTYIIEVKRASNLNPIINTKSNN